MKERTSYEGTKKNLFVIPQPEVPAPEFCEIPRKVLYCLARTQTDTRVTREASHLLGARGRRQSGNREDCAREPSISRERPAAQSRSKRQKSRNVGEANGASEAPTYVDVFGGKKFCYNAA